MNPSTEKFQIGISADFKTEAPGRLEPILTELFDPLPHITYRYFESTGGGGAYVAPQDITDLDAVIALAPWFTVDSFTGNDRLAVIARWGVGYDRIDVPACTANGVLLAITVDAVRRPVAEAIVTLILALAKQLPAKDRVVRTGRWDLRASQNALGLQGKVLGSIGLGNIGSDMVRLLQPFGLGRVLAADPYARPEHLANLGVEAADLETIFRESDFVTVNCPLTAETQGLVNARLLSLMKPTAYLINTARGPIVDTDALVQALQSGQLAGAGLDVTDPEPLPVGHPLLEMENVILSPHTMAWTDQLYRDNGLGACANILSILQGYIPQYTVNRDVAETPLYQAKLAQLRNRWPVGGQ